jgi:uncharacterized membrane protein YkvA (DUF1232 family)
VSQRRRPPIESDTPLGRGRSGEQPAEGDRPRGVRRRPRGAGRTVWHAIRLIPAYLRLLVGLLFDSRVAALDKLLVVGAIAYVVSPIDLIPDFIPFFGEIDDLFVLTLALQHLVAKAGRDVLVDHWTGDPEDLSDLNVGRVLAAASFFLPSPLRGALRKRLLGGAKRPSAARK